MKIEVQLMGQLRGSLAPDQLRLELPPAATIQDALHALVASSVSSKQQFLTEQGKLQPSLLLVVNDRAIPAQQASSIMLRDGDQLTICPPSAADR